MGDTVVSVYRKILHRVTYPRPNRWNSQWSLHLLSLCRVYCLERLAWLNTALLISNQRARVNLHGRHTWVSTEKWKVIKIKSINELKWDLFPNNTEKEGKQKYLKRQLAMNWTAEAGWWVCRAPLSYFSLYKHFSKESNLSHK